MAPETREYISLDQENFGKEKSIVFDKGTAWNEMDINEAEALEELINDLNTKLYEKYDVDWLDEGDINLNVKKKYRKNTIYIGGI